jgi:putative membrane-bound dehydrogenase-like protein
MPRRSLLLFVLLLAAVPPAPAQPPNTQKLTIPLLAPQQALKQVTAPAGFDVSLFTAEPDVQQPIGMAFDSRGRLWVAECYTYAENGKYDERLRDRILVFEDTDNDGRADKRTVFWDQGTHLTSVELGFGGVWALCTPHLLFIPDKDGDAVPDGEPQVVLDGWVSAGHTLVNGLRWGPDGCLYGRHGIQGTSKVGAPGTPADKRVSINCGIWRYHPTRKVFEAVCHGTTNPWGMDWDDHGQLFFINTVIGHLWHVIPGAHYRRMYGEDLIPELYEPIEQTADHVHWDNGKEDWTAQRKGVTDGTSRAGGGHAHSGLMIYQGENWPAEYRGEVFTLNLHGRRINHDHLERAGATYVGRHRADLANWGDPWFRGIDLAYGPDGGVFVLDWSDIGECHEADGVYRTSGRIYKITWRGSDDAKSSLPKDVAGLSNDELVKLQTSRNEWLVRQSRRVLQERAAQGQSLAGVQEQLSRIFEREADIGRKLRALWASYVTGGVEKDRLRALLAHTNEHLRVWAIQLLVDDGQIDDRSIQAFHKLAEKEQSGLVLTFLASAMQRLKPADRFRLAKALTQHDEFAGDRVLPLLVWYGIESSVKQEPARSLELIRASRMPKVTRYVARRLTSGIESNPDAVASLVAMLIEDNSTATRKSVLLGMAEALRGWSKAPAPRNWERAVEAIQKTGDGETVALARELSIVFSTGLPQSEIFAFIRDAKQPRESRRQALRSLVASRAEGLSELLRGLLDDRDMADEAVRGLAAVDLPAHAAELLDRYGRIDGEAKDAVVSALATRANTAAMLLDAVAAGRIPRGEVDALLLRQIQLLGDDTLVQRVARMWPKQRLIPGDKLKRINEYRQRLEPQTLASANVTNGKAIYTKTCGQCHKLFGDGGAIGPELTGSQRSNLAYLLENMLDPSAVVPEQYRMSIVTLGDGRVMSGIVGEQNERTVVLQTPTERLVLERSAIESIKPSELSLMPDGQLDTMRDDEVRDLIAYLMSSGQPDNKKANGAP